MQRNGDGLYSIAAEMSVLGGLLFDPEKMDEVEGVVDEGFFGSANHRDLFRAIHSLHDEGVAIDTVTVMDRLKNWGAFERIGGAVYLSQLMDAAPTSANILYHAGIIREKAHLRRLGQVASSIAELAQSGKPAAEVQDEAERLVYSTGDGLQQVDVALEHVREGMMDALAKLEKNEPDVLTGFDSFDRLTQGFGRGHLVILAARPSMGKTALGMQVATNVAHRKTDGSVAVFSLEMPTEDICRRLMFTEACVDGARFRMNPQEQDYAQLSNAAGILNTLPLYTNDRARTVVNIRGQLRRLKRDTGERLGLVMIDYLGKMQGSGRAEKRVHELGEITGDLKQLAIEFDVPVLLLCQLSRRVEERPDKKPMLSDLRDSGEIEQDADTVLMLYRPEYYFGPTRKTGKNETESLEGKAEVIIAKQRNGPTGSVPLSFRKEYTRFEEFRKW